MTAEDVPLSGWWPCRVLYIVSHRRTWGPTNPASPEAAMATCDALIAARETPLSSWRAWNWLITVDVSAPPTVTVVLVNDPLDPGDGEDSLKKEPHREQ